MLAIRLETHGRSDLPPAAGRAARAPVRRAQAAHDGRGRRAHRRGPGGRTRTTRASRAWARLLRRTSLDELPNLLNVLRGEMSLIGPRPTLPHQVAQYTERQRGRLAIRPGITGWAQVNGRAALPWSERIELDLYYIEHRSLRAGPGDPAAHARDGAGRQRPVQGPDGGLERVSEPGAKPAIPPTPAILLTGVGKRYDIVSCFARAHKGRGSRPQPARARAVCGARACERAADRGPRVRAGARRACARSTAWARSSR